jgi:hypothetical protein
VDNIIRTIVPRKEITTTLNPKKEQATVGFINSFLDLVTRGAFERIDGSL